MTPDEPKGKWTDEPCTQLNMVICLRQQPFLIKLLTETVIELKHSLQQTASKLEATKTELNEAKNRLTKTEDSVTQLKKGSIPIGFTYVQLPKDKAPSELWPTMTFPVNMRASSSELSAVGQAALELFSPKMLPD